MNDSNQEYHILIVDDHLKNAQVLGKILNKFGYTVDIAASGPHAMQIVEEKTPDLVLLDILMPEMDGYEVCRIFKSKKNFKNVPIIFLTAVSDTANLVKGFELGGVDFVKKPYEIPELLARVKTHLEIKNQQVQFEHQANHDTLTGLPTIRIASDRMEVAINHAKRSDEKVALLFLDLDDFKQINDTHGHEAGDEVLKAIAKRIESTIRESDTACRIGGDEFLVLLSIISSREQVEEVCRRLINVVGKTLDYNGHELHVGVSIGIALYPDDASDAASLRRRADDVMYSVKKAGKNHYLFTDNENK